MYLVNIHRNIFWGEQLSPLIYAYTLTATIQDAPYIKAVISLDDKIAHISYAIEKTDWLFLVPASDLCTRKDYLWEHNCLECFFGTSDLNYIEMNFSPDATQNYYNLYQFSDYRTPNVMPPRQADGTLTAHTNTDTKTHHIYHLSVALDTMSDVQKINPCAILYKDKMPIFYAQNHASPPDFHNQDFWQHI